MIHLEIDPRYQDQFTSQLIQQAAVSTLQAENISPSSSLTILITDDPHMIALNSRFRQVDQTTDVLAFPADFTDPDTNQSYLGDIIISFPRAKTQAEDHRHSIDAELQLLTVHGVLHLLGYDHLDAEQKSVMWQVQEAILSKLGVEVSIEEEDS